LENIFDMNDITYTLMSIQHLKGFTLDRE